MATLKKYVKRNGTKAWQFQVYLGTNQVTGKPIKITRRNYSSKKEAQLALSRLQVDFEKNGLINNEHMTFNQLYLLWFEQHSKDIKETTKQRIRIYFDNHILKELGEHRIDKITPLYCQKILNKWSESMAIYKQLRTYVNMVFKYAILIDIIKDNPMERTIIPKRKKQATIETDSYYTKEELKEFFHCLLQLKDRRAYTFFRVLAFIGLRKGEAIIQDTKTESSNQTVKADQQTMTILKEWKNHILQEKFRLGIRQENFNENVVFCNSVLDRKNPYLYKSYANNVLKKVKRHFPNMKIIKVHDFRKTNASLLFESGASIKDVSQRLGHKSTKVTTDIYVMVTQSKQDETAEHFSEYMAF
ncbi:site-specific integrase [Carnobacterium divergens]|uniref:Site-specific integrase n=1 Tax=Carnobacterium divergens TaxID=2748 RepID=A0AAW8RAZ9_CARDV|nr:tyrosine-type recombinase/integrase [Carnobacterium divergens]MDT1958678.1 site-specific integrase [Carnobacterium divergens]MDT1974558.1 site-specific integrase [Carnobacterium divergens]